MRAKRWTFPAGSRAPGWLVEAQDCTVVFNWSALVIEAGEAWTIYPTEPVRTGEPPFLLRPRTRHHRGTAVPTRPIKASY